MAGLHNASKLSHVNLLAASCACALWGWTALRPGRVDPHERSTESHRLARRLSRNGVPPGLLDGGRRLLRAHHFRYGAQLRVVARLPDHECLHDHVLDL